MLVKWSTDTLQITGFINKNNSNNPNNLDAGGWVKDPFWKKIVSEKMSLILNI